VLSRQAGCFDLIYLHRLSNASRYTALARQHCPRARLLYGVAELHHLRLARQARIEDSAALLAESQRLRLAECWAACAADAVLTHSSTEAALLRRALPEAAVHVVPWAVTPRPPPLVYAGDDGRERHGVGFIGHYGQASNDDAARFLAEVVMPLVWQRDPSITCLLAGSDMPAAIRRLARAGSPGNSGGGIVVLGHVADAASVFDRVRLTAAPLRFGAGLKGKVLASFAAGVPCVMSPIAAEGFDLPPLLSGLVGTTPAALAERIIRLHADPAIEDGYTAATVEAALKASIECRRLPSRLAVGNLGVADGE
jgi:glycosyltransferase involved in cell wall biosynthesis